MTGDGSGCSGWPCGLSYLDMPYALHKALQDRLHGCWIRLISFAQSAGPNIRAGIGISLVLILSGMVAGKFGVLYQAFPCPR